MRPAQALVAALGFVADLGAIQQWGLETEKRHVVVDSSMRTNLPRVFAAGDITDYPGKVRLIAVGFGEAATAVNNAAVVIDPSAHVFPGHSSEGVSPSRGEAPPATRRVGIMGPSSSDAKGGPRAHRHAVLPQQAALRRSGRLHPPPQP